MFQKGRRDGKVISKGSDVRAEHPTSCFHLSPYPTFDFIPSHIPSTTVQSSIERDSPLVTILCSLRTAVLTDCNHYISQRVIASDFQPRCEQDVYCQTTGLSRSTASKSLILQKSRAGKRVETCNIHRSGPSGSTCCRGRTLCNYKRISTILEVLCIWSSLRGQTQS